MTRRPARIALGLGVAVAALVAGASPAGAHGVGGREDLPLPVWLFAYCAGAAVVASFAALRLLWPRPRLRAAATGRALAGLRPVERAVLAGTRTVGVLLLALLLVIAFAGPDDSASNMAPLVFYVAFWVGLQVLSLFGDVWRAFNPVLTLGSLVARRRGSPPEGEGPWWTAALGIAAFGWLELAYHDPSSPHAVGWFVAAYTGVHVLAAAVWGRQWLVSGEGFGALFGLIARLAPLSRRPEGGWRWRAPLAGLTEIVPGRRVTALVLVALGATSFDGVSRTSAWSDLVEGRTGWSRTGINTVGLVCVIGVVALAYVVATRAAAAIGRRDPRATVHAFAPSLVPIALAYAVAHYVSLLLFEAQEIVIFASDPLGRGWDLFGTIDWRVNFRWVSTDTIAWLQAGAIVAGHVAGVVVAHDRAIEDLPPRVAERSQYPLLAVMVAYTVGGLALLLGA